MSKKNNISSIILFLAIISMVIIPVSSGQANQNVGVIVVFKDAPNSDDVNYMKGLGGTVTSQYDIIHGMSLDLPQQSLDRLNTICRKQQPDAPICSRIKYIEPDVEVHALGKLVSTEKITSTSAVQTTPWGIGTIAANSAWDITNGNGVKVAVIDTGIDNTHPDLSANVKGGVTFVRGTRSYLDDNGHGTHVSGTIGAINNGFGVVGVAPGVSLYGVKVLDRTGSGSASNVINGINWAANNGMQVITMSLGTSSDVQSIHDAVNNARNKGIIIVAAAGNDYGGAIIYPAVYDGVIAVTATDISNNLAGFSNIGPQADFAAPGVNVYSTYKGGAYATMSGTSMATPHVTGVVALILATSISSYDLNANGKWDPDEVQQKLIDTATDLGTLGFDNSFGYGLVNANNAVR
jgi:subtilisin family serine protease